MRRDNHLGRLAVLHPIYQRLPSVKDGRPGSSVTVIHSILRGNYRISQPVIEDHLSAVSEKLTEVRVVRGKLAPIQFFCQSDIAVEVQPRGLPTRIFENQVPHHPIPLCPRQPHRAQP